MRDMSGSFLYVFCTSWAFGTDQTIRPGWCPTIHPACTARIPFPRCANWDIESRCARHPLPQSLSRREGTARGTEATGRGLCVLHEVRGFVQYAQPLASALPPSWSRRPEMASRSHPDRIGPATRSAVTSKSRRRPFRSCPCSTETQASQACERGPAPPIEDIVLSQMNAPLQSI